MPRLPSADDLRLRTSAYTGNVVGIRDTSAAPAISAVAETLQGVAQKQIELDNRARVSSAETEFLIGQEKLLASLTDDDYETYQKRYEDGITKIKESSAKLIKSPRDLVEFENRIRLLSTRGQLDVAARAKARETDYMRAGLENQIAGAADAALTSSDMNGVLEVVNGLISDHIAQGYIKAEEGEAIRRKFASDVATRRLEMMEPETRLRALGDLSRAENKLLPPDVLAGMKEKTQAEIRALRSLQRTEEQWAKEDAFEQLWTQIDAADNPAAGLALLKSEAFSALSPSQKSALTKHAEDLASGFASVTDPLALEELYNLASNPREFAKADLSPYRARVDRPTWERFRSKQLEDTGRASRTTASEKLASTTNIVNARLDAAGLAYSKADLYSDDEDDKALAMQMAQRRGMFIELFQRELQQMESATGGEVPSQQIESTLNYMLKKARDDGLFEFEVTIPEADRQALDAQFRRAGIVPTPLDIRSAWLYNRRAQMDAIEGSQYMFDIGDNAINLPGAEEPKPKQRVSALPPPELSENTSADVPVGEVTDNIRSGTIDRSTARTGVIDRGQ